MELLTFREAIRNSLRNRFKGAKLRNKSYLKGSLGEFSDFTPTFKLTDISETKQELSVLYSDLTLTYSLEWEKRTDDMGDIYILKGIE